MATGNRTISEETVWFSYRQGDPATRRGKRAWHCLGSHREEGDSPLNPIAETVLGVPGEARFYRAWQAAVSRGAPRHLAGTPWVDYAAFSSGLQLRSAAKLPLPPGHGSPAVFHLVCPEPLRQLTQRCQITRADGWGTTPRPPVYRTSARAGGHRPLWSCLPDWRLHFSEGGAQHSQGHYWLQYAVTQWAREGRGLLREGHHRRLFQGPPGAIFNLFFPPEFLFVCCLQSVVQDYNYSGHRSVSLLFCFHKSVSHFCWWEAFRSCRPWL